jgi:tetratricopeptide (TPR) repeat protein
MLNYIIPPIVIVLSLAGLIIFLFRKSNQISQDLIVEEEKRSKVPVRLDKKKLFRFTQLMLQISEKGMQYFKLLSLKFYNKADNVFHSIKEKREERLDIQKEFPKETNDEKSKENVVIVKEKEMMVDNIVIKEEEVEMRPMISREVVQPDSKTLVKSEFERALIERIALNPRDIEAYERLGDYYIEIGNFNDSLSCFEEVLKLSPMNRKSKIKVKRLQKIVFDDFS